jgi:hypothetical protein
MFQNTADDTERANRLPPHFNHTFNEQTDFLETFPINHNVSSINESPMEDKENTTHIPFSLDRMSNISVLNNQTVFLLENRKTNCSMIKHVEFIFTLGRKMPLYVDIISLSIGTIGIIGNVATVVTVANNLKPRKPYYLSILTLAVADLLCIGFRIGTIFLDLEVTMYIECLKPSYTY